MNTALSPRTALEAAQDLAAKGHHVHYVTEGESRCITNHCTQQQPAT